MGGSITAYIGILNPQGVAQSLSHKSLVSGPVHTLMGQFLLIRHGSHNLDSLPVYTKWLHFKFKYSTSTAQPHRLALSCRFLQHDLSGTSAEYAELLFELEGHKSKCLHNLPQDRNTEVKRGEGRSRKKLHNIPAHKYNNI